MKLRKGVLPLLLFAIAFVGWAIYTVVTTDPVPMEKEGESVFSQP
jgi:hypothetical protein